MDGDKAQRIVDSMRSSVAKRGVAGSTFDHVAREAGVSRGLLHYHFGTKEALLVEVVKRDCELRMGTLQEALGAASTADDLIGLLKASLESYVAEEPEFIVLLFEMFVLSRQNEDVAAEFADLLRRTRAQVAEVLERLQAAGVLQLRGTPDAIADLLFAIGDGAALRMLTEPQHDWAPFIDAGVIATRALLV